MEFVTILHQMVDGYYRSRFPESAEQNRGDDTNKQEEIKRTLEPQFFLLRRDHLFRNHLFLVVIGIEKVENDDHQHYYKHHGDKHSAGGPEEINPFQEAEKERRISQRCE